MLLFAGPRLAALATILAAAILAAACSSKSPQELSDDNRYRLLEGVTATTVRDFVRRVFDYDAYIEVQRS